MSDQITRAEYHDQLESQRDLRKEILTEISLLRGDVKRLVENVAILQDRSDHSRDWPARWAALTAIAAFLTSWIKAHWRP